MLGKAISNFIDICPAVTKAKQSTIWEKGGKSLLFICEPCSIEKEGEIVNAFMWMKSYSLLIKVFPGLILLLLSSFY